MRKIYASFVSFTFTQKTGLQDLHFAPTLESDASFPNLPFSELVEHYLPITLGIVVHQKKDSEVQFPPFPRMRQICRQGYQQVFTQRTGFSNSSESEIRCINNTRYANRPLLGLVRRTHPLKTVRVLRASGKELRRMKTNWCAFSGDGLLDGLPMVFGFNDHSSLARSVHRHARW